MRGKVSASTHGNNLKGGPIRDLVVTSLTVQDSLSVADKTAFNQGDQGVTGARGFTGVDGYSGVDGEKGDTGVDGEKGDPGENGYSGVDGEKGYDGEQGPEGPSSTLLHFGAYLTGDVTVPSATNTLTLGNGSSDANNNNYWVIKNQSSYPASTQFTGHTNLPPGWNPEKGHFRPQNGTMTAYWVHFNVQFTANDIPAAGAHYVAFIFKGNNNVDNWNQANNLYESASGVAFPSTTNDPESYCAAVSTLVWLDGTSERIQFRALWKHATGYVCSGSTAHSPDTANPTSICIMELA